MIDIYIDIYNDIADLLDVMRIESRLKSLNGW
jgi:hypothetical protein